jgi:hypothetical protein
MLASSAIDSVEKVIPIITMRYIQMPLAVPPFVSGTIMPAMEETYPLPRMRE